LAKELPEITTSAVLEQTHNTVSFRVLCNKAAYLYYATAYTGSKTPTFEETKE